MSFSSNRSGSSWSESDLLPLSALQHLAFCERQCCLIHVEQAWEENRFTAEGRLLHERVHGQDAESRGDVLTVRGLRIRSLVLGLSGVADVVEFHRTIEAGIILSERNGFWSVFPVEYKRGKPKKDSCDEVQLCAQAICLEEMTGAIIKAGALFYGSQHRRHEVLFDERLRQETADLATKLHALVNRNQTPAAHFEKKCESCSLLEICMPQAAEKSVAGYMEKNLATSPPGPLS